MSLLRNRIGVCSEIEEASTQKSKRRLFSQKLGLLRNYGPISEIEEAPAFSALSAPVTCTLSFAEITGNLLKISDEIESA
ncbi:hypothetical protein ACFX1T_020141 [Malus domestica]